MFNFLILRAKMSDDERVKLVSFTGSTEVRTFFAIQLI